MKKIIILMIVVVFLVGCSGGLEKPYCGDGECGPVEEQRGICPEDCESISPTDKSSNDLVDVEYPIYVTLVSHNEAGGGKTGAYPEMYGSEENYTKYRETLLEFVGIGSV
jgi:hypothetical protein